MIASDVERQEALRDSGFGRHYTDHMAVARWTPDGWSDLEVHPLTSLELHPATAVLHYAQEVFEGLKAYRGLDGSVRLFRVDDHAARFDRSARRMAMPVLPAGTFRAACERLVRQDDAWVGEPGTSLYLRPFMVATTAALGAGRAADSHLFAVIASPTTSTRGLMRDPISVWATPTFVRSVRGGTGSAKTGANYAVGMLAQDEARAEGCDQVLWLDALDRTWVEELGAMNVFLVRGTGSSATLVTPPLSDTLLAGITRDSVLALADGLGIAVKEVPVSIDEWRAGGFSEAFASGSAGGLTPIVRVRTPTAQWHVGDGTHPVGERLAAALHAVQVGSVGSPEARGWLTPLERTSR